MEPPSDADLGIRQLRQPFARRTHKRLESGTFAVLDRDEINARELYLLLEGIEVVRQRVLVLGRGNYLFAGSEAAAHRTAILCSLDQSPLACLAQLRAGRPDVETEDVKRAVPTYSGSPALRRASRWWARSVSRR
jgi:hypothetical protein